MTIEIVDLPIDSMVIFYSYVCLPEGRDVIWGKLQPISGSWQLSFRIFSVSPGENTLR